MRQQKVWVLVLLMISLAACGTDSGPTPPDNPPPGGIEVNPDFELTVTGLKPTADTYVDGQSTYAEQDGVHFITGTAVRNAGFENESRVSVYLRLRGVLEERTYTVSPNTDEDDDIEAEITVVDDGFTSYNGTLIGGNLGITEITESFVEGSFLFVFEDRSDAPAETVANFKAEITELPPTQ